MKRQVRRGTFETNSSSTHAICITKSEYRHNSFSHIDFEIGEFGWEMMNTIVYIIRLHI